MNTNKGQLTYVQDVGTFNKMLTDPTKNVSFIIFFITLCILYAHLFFKFILK